eukprot:GEMP01009284.1.p1 GENE.GEMP01009284.1~~GEMP01009284.1.p1  ORF type:complete len:1024 (+),score=208.95 GEMP01009284.1:154-3225(+)
MLILREQPTIHVNVEWDDVYDGIPLCLGLWISFVFFAIAWEGISRCKPITSGRSKRNFEGLVEKLERMYSRPQQVFIMTSFLCSGAILQCCLFVVRTYSHEVTEIGVFLDLFICVAYTLDTILRFIVEEAKISFVTSIDFAIDVFIVPSVVKLAYYFCFSSDGVPNITFNFLASLRFLLTYRRMHVYIEDIQGKDSVVLQMMTMMVYSLIFLFFTSTMFFLLETLGDFAGIENWIAHNKNGEEMVTFFSSMYFVMVTISTVGYGDILPTTVLARIVTISFIIGGIVAFSIGTSELLEVLSRNRAGRGSFASTPGFTHVIVTGNPSFQAMKVFLEEFFHPDHVESQTYKVVFLLQSGVSDNNEPAPDMMNLMEWIKLNTNIRIRKQTLAFQGSVMEPLDLKRMQTAEARCVFILPNMQTATASVEDSDNILRVLALRNYRKDLRILVVLLRGDLKSLLVSSGIHEHDFVVVEAFKMELLGKNCAVPGYIPLVSNLFRSETESAVQECTSLWQKQYVVGAAMEFYYLPLSRAYVNWKFADVVIDILDLSEEKNVLLFGVAFSERLILNPGRDWRIPLLEVVEGIFIASDSSAVQQRPWEGVSDDTFKDVHTRHKVPLTMSPKIANLFKQHKVLPDTVRVDDEREEKKTTVMEQVRRLSVQYSSSQLDQGPTVVEKVVSQGGHVLLCVQCEHARVALNFFIKPLRAAYLQTLKPIVVLSLQEPEDWAQVMLYDDVYYMRGSMLSLPDMNRACFDKADAIVMLHSAGTAKPTFKGRSNPYVVDADVLFSMRQVEARISKISKVLTVADIALDSNGEYLSTVAQMDSLVLPETLETASRSTFVRSRAHHPLAAEEPHVWASHCAKRVHDNAQNGVFGRALGSQARMTNLYTTARFASGQVMASSVFIFLMVNAFHKPKDIRLIAELNAAEIQLRKLPARFVRRSLRDYIVELLAEGVVCLGLYRNRTRRVDYDCRPTASSFFVSTSPDITATTLQEDDYAYCLVSTFKGLSVHPSGTRAPVRNSLIIV